MKKNLFLILVAVFSMNLVAQNGTFISKAKENKILKNLAKEFRKTLKDKDHDYVTSNIVKVNNSVLFGFLDNDQNRAEQKLDSEELLSLTVCQINFKCRVYAVDLSSEYWGGYGTETYWVMLDRTTGKYSTLFHVTYTE
ncbi:hypothetical protein N9N67_08300 [Bacteriovoracaceae bacterium]|nr:hypothetical protein [Bacteriovoracaceae bacterium]